MLMVKVSGHTATLGFMLIRSLVGLLHPEQGHGQGSRRGVYPSLCPTHPLDGRECHQRQDPRYQRDQQPLLVQVSRTVSIP
jgi:hypothetical protein